MRSGVRSLIENRRRVPISFLMGAAVFLLCFLWSLTPGARFMLLPGIVGAAWFALYGLCGFLPSRIPRRILRGILLGLLVLAAALFLLIEALILVSAPGDRAQDARAGVIFGAGVDGDVPSLSLLARLEAGYAWWEEDPSRILIVTGGKGAGENAPEGQVMAAWLLQKGVPASQIRIEDQARNTRENAALSAPFLEQLLSPGEPVAVISNEFHLYRCKFLIGKLGYQPRGIPAETPYVYLKITYCLREFCSVLLMWLRI